MLMSDQIDALATALAKAQGSMKPAAKDAKNPHLRNSYADLPSVVETAREPLSTNGLSISQFPLQSSSGMRLTTMLMHNSGQYIIDDGLPLEYEASKGVNLAQALGSMLTYCRRYGYMGMTGIVAADATEDDGTKAGPPNQKRQKPPATIPPELRKQAGTLADSINDSNDPGWISDQIDANGELLEAIAISGPDGPAWRARLESVASQRIEELNMSA